jgi:hypothetical protein
MAKTSATVMAIATKAVMVRASLRKTMMSSPMGICHD